MRIHENKVKGGKEKGKSVRKKLIVRAVIHALSSGIFRRVFASLLIASVARSASGTRKIRRKKMVHTIFIFFHLSPFLEYIQARAQIG